MKKIFNNTNPQTIKDACELGISMFIEKYQGMIDHERLIITYNAIRMQYNIAHFHATPQPPVNGRSVTFSVIAMDSSKAKPEEDSSKAQ